MFKKLKDKITEEGKLSFQQIAQVISPTSSTTSFTDNNSSQVQDDNSSYSSDFFSIGGDDDQTKSQTETWLHNVDLSNVATSPVSHSQTRSRRSSISSVTSDASSLFPIFENSNNLQSDFDSEFEDRSNQLEHLSKEQIYIAYRKTLTRYNKYKGRWADLLKGYKDLQHENIKTKNILQESQDKAIRRMNELKEQCVLEQKAKAHLEETLRSDLEEKDHVIETLKTKIVLLRAGNEMDHDLDQSETLPKEEDQVAAEKVALKLELENLKQIANNNNSQSEETLHNHESSNEPFTNVNLKTKVDELKSQIATMKTENEQLSQLLSKNDQKKSDGNRRISESSQKLSDSNLKMSDSENSSDLIDFSKVDGLSVEVKQAVDEKTKKIENLTNILVKCKERINNLTADVKNKDEELTVLKYDNNKFRMQLEESEISVAENKLAIHSELEAKEKQIISLNQKIEKLEADMKRQSEVMEKTYDERIKLKEDELSSLTETCDTLNEALKKLTLQKSEMETQIQSAFTARDEAAKQVAEQTKTIEKFEASKEKAAELVKIEMNAELNELKNKLNHAFQQQRKEYEEEKQRLETEIKNLKNTQQQVAKEQNLEKLLQVKEELVKEIEERLEKEGEKMKEVLDENNLLKIQIKKVSDDFEHFKRESEKSIENYELVTEIKESVEKQLDMSARELKDLIYSHKELEVKNSDLIQILEQEHSNFPKENCSRFLQENSYQQIHSQAESYRLELQKLTEDYERLKIEKRELLHSLTVAKEDVEENFSKYIKYKEIADNVNRKLNDLDNEKRDELLKISEELKCCQLESHTLRESVERLQIENNKIIENTQNLKDTCESEKKARKESYTELENCRKENNELKVSIKNLKKEKVALSEQLETQSQELLDVQKKWDNLVEQNKIIKESLECEQKKNLSSVEEKKTYDKEILQLQTKLESKELELDKCKNDCKYLTECLETEKCNTASLKTNIETFEKDRNKLETEVVNLRQEVCDLNTEKQMLEKNINLQKEEQYRLENLLKDTNKEYVERENSLKEAIEELNTEKRIMQESLSDAELQNVSLVKKLDAVNGENTQLLGNEKKLEVELQNIKIEKTNLEETIENLRYQNKELCKSLNQKKVEKESLANSITEMEQENKEIKELLNTYKQENSNSSDTQQQLLSYETKIDLLEKESEALSIVNKNLEKEIKTTKEEFNLSKIKIEEIMHENLSLSGLQTETTQNITKLESQVQLLTNEKNAIENEYKNKMSVLKYEISFLTKKYEEDLVNVEQVNDSKINELNGKLDENDKILKELLDKYEKCTNEAEELRAGLNEKEMKVVELEKYLAEVKDEIDKKYSGNKDVVETHNTEIKQLLTQYETELARKSEEIQNLQVQLMENTEAIDTLKIIKQENKKLRKELVEKDSLLEYQTMEIQTKQNEFLNNNIEHDSKLEAEKQTMKAEFEKILKKQRSDLEKEIERVRKERDESASEQIVEYESKLGELEKERKELTYTSQIAVAAIETGTGSIDILRKQLMQQTNDMKESKKQFKKEISELRRLLSLKTRTSSNHSLENDTEHEYLRNILFEYMMGREQMVLAKVLSAIVKFDQNQTDAVLEKEKVRQTLLGQLGISS